MKKAMICLLCIISLLLSAAFFFYQKAADNHYLDNIETTSKLQSVAFYVQKDNISPDQEISTLKRLSQKYHLSIVRTDVINQDHQETVYKSGIFSEDYFDKSNIKLVNGKYPKLSGEFLSTGISNNRHQTGIIRDLFQDNHLIFGHLQDIFQKRPELNAVGSYTMLVPYENERAATNELSKIFKIPANRLLVKNSEKGYGQGSLFMLSLVFSGILFAVFLLMNVFYPLLNLKTVGTMKLLGFKSIDAWLFLNRDVFLIPIFVVAVSFIIQKFILSGTDLQYFLQQLVFQMLIFLFALSLSLLTLIAINKYSIHSLIKGIFNLKFSLYASYGIKILVFLGLVAAIPPISHELSSLANDLSVQKIYEQRKNELTLANIEYVGNEFQNFVKGNDTLSPKIIKLYKKLEKTANAGYVSTERIQAKLLGNPDQGKWKDIYFTDNDQYTLMTVNRNFLRSTPYRKLTNASDSANQSKLTFWVPESLRTDKEKIQLFAHIRASNIIPDKDTTKDLASLPVTVNYYQNIEKDIFSENLEFASKNRGFIKDPIFMVLDDEFLNDRSSYLQNAALYNPLRITDTVGNRKAIKQAIVDSELKENNIRFANVLTTGFAKEVSTAKTSLIAWSSIMLLASIVSLLSSYYIILIILASRRKEMLVKRLMGYSIFKKYEIEVAQFAFIYFAGGVEIFILAKDSLPILIYGFLVVSDILISCVMIKHQENKNISTALKGEDA